MLDIYWGAKIHQHPSIIMIRKTMLTPLLVPQAVTVFAVNSVYLTTERSMSSQQPLYVSTIILPCWVRDITLDKGGCCKNTTSRLFLIYTCFTLHTIFSSFLVAFQILTGCRLSHQHSWREAGRRRKRKDFDLRTINQSSNNSCASH